MYIVTGETQSKPTTYHTWASPSRNRIPPLCTSEALSSTTISTRVLILVRHVTDGYVVKDVRDGVDVLRHAGVVSGKQMSGRMSVNALVIERSRSGQKRTGCVSWIGCLC